MTTLTSVTKRWGERAVLSDVTFTFEPATTYVVAGPSGAGKTTLLNLVAGYVTPDAGVVQAPAQIGYLFQDDLLFSALTARDNVLLRAALISDRTSLAARVESCLGAVGMLDRADQPAAVLSGGERQRVQLANLIAYVFGHATCVIVSHDEYLAKEIGAAQKLLLENGDLIHA
jgi:ABC-type multidrug transport system ATPase subunit